MAGRRLDRAAMTGAGAHQVAREFFRAEHGREPVNAELTGQIAKDFGHARRPSRATTDVLPGEECLNLWAVADPAVVAVIEQAHQAAIRMR